MRHLRQTSLAGRKRLPAALILVVVMTALLVPVCIALHDLAWDGLQVRHLFGTLALLALALRVSLQLPRILALAALSSALGLMLFVRLAFLGVVQFSGAGFTDDLFIHLEPRSVELAWEQYRGLFLLLLTALACVPLAARALLARTARRSRAREAVLIVTTLLVAVLARNGLPEYMLARATYDWFAPKSLDLPATQLQRWRDSGLVQVDLPRKSTVRASAANPPRNLVLVYLESLGAAVIQSQAHPGLMPNLSRRLQEHGLLRDYFAASYITIEGITNSQCGTVFPFERNSESLAGFDGVAEEQACLGDVLHRAGYVQTYLGGAESRFAGKGHFLSVHGYDRVLGYGHWLKLGLGPRPGGWGLGDPDLFDQAFAEIERKHAAAQPFNVTLLTIGSHLPGFSYEECQPYGRDEPFLEALNCTDQLLERFLSRIEAAGFLDDTVVVVTADHNVFPNRLMKRLFGDDAVDDPHLPLLVLGKDVPREVAVAGASYDLAPTVLDLLGIRSDVRFALGRSLLRAEPARRYFPTRYRHIFDGRPVAASGGECGDAVAVPLNACDARSLMTLLRIQNTAFSNDSTARLDCGPMAGIRIRIPDEEGVPLQFLVNGEDLAESFTWKARSNHAAEHGLFVLALSDDGSLLDRSFVPEDEARALPARPVTAQAARYLVAWHGEYHTAPSWLGRSGAVHAAVALFDAQGSVTALPGHASAGFAEFVLAQEACTAWIGSPSTPDNLDELLADTRPDTQHLDPATGFCPVDSWGPQEVFAGERFNLQPDGSSAFWMRTDCAPEHVMLEFDGQLIETSERLPILTAALNADRHLMQEGTWPVGLYDPQVRRHYPIGTLKVLPARAPIELPEPVAQVWPALAPPIQPPVLIAHAGGGWRGQHYLNSREALDHNHALGHRVFELDFSWTRDERLVLMHDWEASWWRLFPDADHSRLPDREEFLAARMLDGQTPLDLARLGDWLRAHPDAYVVTDIRGRGLFGLQQIKAELGDVQERIIPQMTHAFRYPEIRALGYAQVIFNLHSSSLDTDSLLAFIRDTPLFAVTLNPEQRPDALQILAELGRAGIPAYVHTFNALQDLEHFRALGAHGIYTDFLHQDRRGTLRLQPATPAPDPH